MATLPNILFAESTIYKNTKRSLDKTYTSNIRVKFINSLGKEDSMALYQVYYNPGQKNWGLWRCPYIRGAWERPKFYPNLQTAIKKATELYREENLGEEEYDVAETSHITYSKKRGKHMYEIITETTYFSENPE